MTRIEKIRNMTSEELAEVFYANDLGYGYCHSDCDGDDCIKENQIQCIVRWLNSEVN